MLARVKIIYAVVLVFLAVSFLKIFPTYSDETFYFNVAKQVSEGEVLYNDFFFAHPPVQTVILGFLFGLFGSSYFSAKLLPILSSASCLLLVYLVGKQLNTKSPAISPIILLLTPAFLSYSSVGYGVWLAAAFILLSYFLLLKRKTVLSVSALTTAFFTRYLSLLYLPLLLYKSHDRKRFLLSASFLLIVGFFALSLLFGPSFITDTIFYHLAKFGERDISFITQYVSLNLFLLIPLFLFRRTRFFLIVFMTDLLIMMLFKVPFYHYFLISLPFYTLLLSEIKDKKMVFICALFGIILNVQTITYYNTQNPLFSELNSFFTGEEVVFGEPIVSNYLSFTGKSRILGDVFDSYPQHLSFEKINFSTVPDFVIDRDDYYHFLFDETDLVLLTNSTPAIIVYSVRR